MKEEIINIADLFKSQVNCAEFSNGIKKFNHTINSKPEISEVKIHDWKYIANSAIGKMESIAKYSELNKKQVDDFMKTIAIESSEIKLPETWLKEKNIGLHEDDTIITNYELINGCSTGATEIFITSFADRENTGKQPVADWVTVDYIVVGCSGYSSKAVTLNWELKVYGPDSAIKSWKPNIEALYEIYLAEIKQKEMDSLDGIAKKCPDEILGKEEIENNIEKYLAKQDDKMKAYLEENKKDMSHIGAEFTNNVDKKIKFFDPKEECEKMLEFAISNNLMLPGESISDCVIRELAEKHDIDMRTSEQKEAGEKIRKLEKLISAVETGLKCRQIAEFLHKNNFKG